MNAQSLSRIPQIERLLSTPEVERWFAFLSRPYVSSLASGAVAELREEIRGGAHIASPSEEARARLQAACRSAARRRIRRVINATGTVLHTNLGRSPLAEEVWRTTGPANCGYASLEMDMEEGRRGRRGGLVPELLLLAIGAAGAQRALVVNNNAAALLLALTALAAGREVIVSRGEQVQIGGGFRIPEILTLSGARLVEVGTTNVTTLGDYRRAFGPQTAAVLVVHRSNFRLRGFTAQPRFRELSAALPEGTVLIADQGSGALGESLPGERRVAAYLDQGAHLVCFSADKVLGGPQAGVVAGGAELVEALARHPLYRALRPGKTIASLLEETLVRRLNGEQTVLQKALATDAAALRRRGRRLLRGIPSDLARLVNSRWTPGGGSAPDENLPSVAVELSPAAAAFHGETELQAWLRDQDPPIVATLGDGRVLLDLSTVFAAELPRLRAALLRLAERA